SLYLDRFLNVPAAPVPAPNGHSQQASVSELPALFDRQQQVEPAARIIADHLYAGADPAALMATLGKLLLREDRDFHTIQTVEAAFRQFTLLNSQPHTQ